jgi:hypothetical protein
VGSSWAKVTLTLEVDSSDVDLDSRTGLTEVAFDRLLEAVADAGFQIDEGPDLVTGGVTSE